MRERKKTNGLHLVHFTNLAPYPVYPFNSPTVSSVHLPTHHSQYEVHSGWPCRSVSVMYTPSSQHISKWPAECRYSAEPILPRCQEIYFKQSSPAASGRRTRSRNTEPSVIRFCRPRKTSIWRVDFENPPSYGSWYVISFRIAPPTEIPLPQRSAYRRHDISTSHRDPPRTMITPENVTETKIESDTMIPLETMIFLFIFP